MSETAQSPPPLPVIDVDQLHKLAKKTEGRGMMGSWLRNCEAEVIVSQLLCGASYNMKQSNGPYSVREDNVLKGRQNCGTDNLAAYRRLQEGGYFVERAADDETHLYPTQKLLDAVAGHFAQKE